MLIAENNSGGAHDSLKLHSQLGINYSLTNKLVTLKIFPKSFHIFLAFKDDYFSRQMMLTGKRQNNLKAYSGISHTSTRKLSAKTVNN